MKWIGLSGGLASGKSTVSTILRQRGYQVVDADQVARDVLQKGTIGLRKIVETFGSELLGSNGELNRDKMAELVFSSKEELKKLEMIVHPLVQEKVRNIRKSLEEKNEKIAFYDVPLLFEKNLESQFDATVLVYANETLQKSRMKSRNNWSDAEIQSRLSAQLSMNEKLKRAKWVLKNESTIADLEKQVDELLGKL